TGDPVAGNQQTSETNYVSYARQPVTRDNTGWTVSGNQVTNAATITFPTCTGGSSTVTHFAIGTVISGTGKILHCGLLNTPLSIVTDVAPVMQPGDIVGTEI